MNVKDLNKYLDLAEHYKKLAKDAPWPYNQDIQRLVGMIEELVAELKRTVRGRALQDLWDTLEQPWKD